MVIELIKWWYGSGWLKALTKTIDWANGVKQSFSVPILMKTLFSPWRQIVALPGSSFDTKMRAMVDNFVSRLVGFFVRLIALFASLLMLIGAVVAGFVIAVLWPFIPVFFVYFLARSFLG